MVSEPIELGWMAVCCHVIKSYYFFSDSLNIIRLQVVMKSGAVGKTWILHCCSSINKLRGVNMFVEITLFISLL